MRLLKRVPGEKVEGLADHADWTDELTPALMEWGQAYANAINRGDVAMLMQLAGPVKILVGIAYAMGFERAQATAKTKKFLERGDDEPKTP